MLDFVSTADQFGKPVNADLKLGLATAPVLYAARTYPELWPLIERKFSHQGDVAKVGKGSGEKIIEFVLLLIGTFLKGT